MIAVGYTDNVSLSWLVAGMVGVGTVFASARCGIRSFPVYTAIGTFVWLAFHESGVHATIAGVILGLMTPSKSYVSEGLVGDILQRASQVFQGGGFRRLTHRADSVRQL